MFILVTLTFLICVVSIISVISLVFIYFYRYMNQASLMLLLNILSYEYVPYFIVLLTLAMYLYLNIYKSLQKNITYITLH